MTKFSEVSWELQGTHPSVCGAAEEACGCREGIGKAGSLTHSWQMHLTPRLGSGRKGHRGRECYPLWGYWMALSSLLFAFLRIGA